MKRTILFLLACLCVEFSTANPTYPPDIFLYELSFDANNDWKMAFAYSLNIDSIYFSSMKTTSVYMPKNKSDYETILTKDSLILPFELNANGDSLTIIYYIKHRSYGPDTLVETVVYGDYPGASVPAPKQGQVITRILHSNIYPNYHSIMNHDGSMTGKIHGKIYDKNKDPIISGSFSIDPLPVSVNCLEGSFQIHGLDVGIDGSYSSNLYSMIYNLDKIVVCYKNNSDHCSFYTAKKDLQIKPLHFTILPDSSIEMDIYFLEDYVKVDQLKNIQPDIFKIYPNPVNDELNYEVFVPVKATNVKLRIADFLGKIITEEPVKEKQGVLSLPPMITNGNYTIQLLMNNKTYQTQQFIVTR